MKCAAVVGKWESKEWTSTQTFYANIPTKTQGEVGRPVSKRDDGLGTFCNHGVRQNVSCFVFVVRFPPTVFLVNRICYN